MGIPAIPMVTRRFVELASTTAFKKGIPNLRITYVPHPITDRSAELSNTYLNGNDPVSGKPMLKEIYDGLTRPLSAQDRKTGFMEREKRTRFLTPDTAAHIQQMFQDKMWTDGLPVVLPTEQLVKEIILEWQRGEEKLR